MSSSSFPTEPLMRWPEFTETWRLRLDRWRRPGSEGADAENGKSFNIKSFNIDVDAHRVLSGPLAALGSFQPSHRERSRWPAPVAERPLTEAAHRDQLGARLGPSPVDLAWVGADLELLRDRKDRLERAGWELEPEVPDQALIRAWHGWFDGKPWPHRDLWESRYTRLATEALRAVTHQLHVPDGAARRALADLEDNFFFVLLGDGVGVPAWLDVALLVLERAPGGPLAGLSGALDADGWTQLRGCLRRRGAWPLTLRQLRWSGDEPRDPDALERLVDLHVTRKVLSLPAPGPGLDLSAAWRVLRSNRGRMRGRLRALLSEGPRPALRDAVLAHPALARATREAMARFWFHQVWQELRRDFTFDGRNLATPPCALPAEAAPVEPSEPPAGLLRTWVLLVILRGRWDHLQRWAEEGSTGDRDSTWGRLLSESLPAALAIGPDGGRDLRRLRDHLSMALQDVLIDLLPELRAIAALAAGERLPDAVRAALSPRWDPRVPLPERGFPDVRRRAIQLLNGRPVTEEEPWTQYDPLS